MLRLPAEDFTVALEDEVGIWTLHGVSISL